MDGEAGPRAPTSPLQLTENAPSISKVRISMKCHCARNRSRGAPCRI